MIHLSTRSRPQFAHPGQILPHLRSGMRQTTNHLAVGGQGSNINLPPPGPVCGPVSLSGKEKPVNVLRLPRNAAQ